MLARYFERMKAIVERHGGTVEKFIGDAVMAVFGVPAVHEDDALRALRAAVEMRDALPGAGRRGPHRRDDRRGRHRHRGAARHRRRGQRRRPARAGRPAGRDPDRRRDAAAGPRRRRGRAGRAARAEGQGRAGRRLPPALRARREALAPHLEAPMVGRETELRRLASACEPGARRPRLPAVHDPRLGRGRQVAARRRVPGARSTAPSSCGAAACPTARASPTGRWSRSSSSSRRRDRTRSRPQTIRALVGDEAMVTSSDEIAWAFRKLLEAVAAERRSSASSTTCTGARRPSSTWSSTSPTSPATRRSCCSAWPGPELLDRRTGWAGGKVNATTVLLEPLAPEETER